MPRTVVRAEIFEKNTIDAMKSLGVYRSEYSQIIKIYSRLLEQYERLKSELRPEDYILRTEGVITLEHLRTDIIKYSDALCLNPKTFGKTKIKEPMKKSKLEAALELMSNG